MSHIEVFWYIQIAKIATEPKVIVTYLERNQFDNQGWSLELYIGIPFSHCFHEMSLDETYRGGLTLRGTANIFNIELSIASSLEWHIRQIISPNLYQFGEEL